MALYRTVWAPSILTASLVMVVMQTCTQAAPTDGGFVVKAPPSSPSVSAAPATPEPSSNNLRWRLKQWLQTTVPTAVAEVTNANEETGAEAKATAGRLVRLPRRSEETDIPDKRDQMLKMISALEQLYRTINGSLSTRITFMPRANGRNSGRKNKVLPASEGGVKITTVTPVETGGTVSRASADIFIPSLTGRNFKKSLPPQPKKSNKRVCFWKYCSQN